MFANKFLKYSTLFLAAGSLSLTGCGDDDGNSNTDGGGDSSCGDIHNPCDAGVDEDPAITVASPEGGMVIFEYIGFSTGLQAVFPAQIARNISHFTSSGGADHVFLTPGSGDGLNGLDECNNVSADDITWPANDVSVQTHVNVGDLTISGGSQDLVVSPITDGTDAEMTDMISRLHSGAWYQTLKGTGMPAPEDDVPYSNFVDEDTTYSVSMEGSAEYPATTYEDALYMPSAMVMTNPVGDSAIDRPVGGFTEDFTVSWDSGTSAGQPDNNEILSLVMLVDPSGTNIIEFCVTANDGEFVIPAAVLEEFAAEAPQGGVILVGNVSHNLGRFDNRGVDGDVFDRRIDFLGMWCEAMAFSINQLK